MFLWIVFLMAQALHVLCKAALARRSNLNGIVSLHMYFAVNWAALLIRVCAATALFFWWFDDPRLVDRFFAAIAGMLQPGILRSVLEGVKFPLNLGTAAIYGLFCDSVLDKAIAFVPWMRRDIPPLEGGE